MTRIVIALVAAIATLVTACGSSAVANPSEAGAGVASELDFVANTIDGEEFDGKSLAGTPAVLWFWAPWYPVCQREAPTVGQVAAAHPDVTFVGVAGLDEVTAMQRFVHEYPVERFTHLADTDGAIWTRFGVTQQPAYAFIAADGDVDVAKGALSETELSERVTALSSR